MRALLASSRWLALIAAVGSVAAATVEFVAGAVKAVLTIKSLLEGASASVRLVQVMDSFLIGAALLLFGLGIYELFIGRLELPSGLVIEGTDDLEARLANIVVLVLAVDFLEHFVAWEDGAETLRHAAAAALMSLVLVAYSGRRIFGSSARGR
jgi:uncharacterized membrane protein YqhA